MQKSDKNISININWLMIVVIGQFLITRGNSFQPAGDFFVIAYILYLLRSGYTVNKKQSTIQPGQLPEHSEKPLMLLEELPKLNEHTECRLMYDLCLLDPSLPLKTLLNFSLKIYCETFPEKTAALFLCKDTKAEFAAAARTNSEGQCIELSTKDDTVLEMSKRVSSIIDCSDESQKYLFVAPTPIKQSEQFESGLLIPIHFLGHLEGILAVTTSSEDEKEGLKEQISLSYAEGLALVLKNHSLFSSIYERERIKEQNITAEELALSEMSEEPPSQTGWSIGQIIKLNKTYTGEFCFYSPRPNGDIFILIGKCSIGGIKAAVFASKLKAMVNTLGSKQITPAEMLNQLSFYLKFDTECDTFATAAALNISKNNLEAELALAGAPVPFVIRTKVGFAEQLRTESGIPLGLFNEGSSPYSDFTIQLIPGDVICLFTDSLLSCSNNNNEPMSADTLRSALEDIPDGKASEMAECFNAMVKQNLKHKSSFITILAKTE